MLKFLESHMLQLLLKMDDGNTLPDLNNEKTSEQIVFEQKVFRCNESFARKVNELINFLKSPVEHHCYPKKATNNRNMYMKQARQFTYDVKKGILYKEVKDSVRLSK